MSDETSKPTEIERVKTPTGAVYFIMPAEPKGIKYIVIAKAPGQQTSLWYNLDIKDVPTSLSRVAMSVSKSPEFLQ